MKYVITGGAGHISKPLAEKLISEGHHVTIISRNEKNIAGLVSKGAKAAIGSVEDIDFLSKTFAGADAVYTMVPPNFSITGSWKKWIGQIGKNYAQAIKESGVKYVVNLSSIGAHLPDGCGPVSGLHQAEKALDELSDVNIRHLRPAYFYTNLFANISMIKSIGIMGGNYGNALSKMVIVHPNDIAAVAAEELSGLTFTGHSFRYISSDEKTGAEIATAIGEAIGKPGLNWVVFNDNDALNGMLQAGLPEEIAKNYQEMGQAMYNGKFFEDYWKHRPSILGKIKIEDFAKTFAAVFNNEAMVAVH
ncbi:MAG TPA: NAD(P)H-binding protein [Puia sp.]|nr:NAD(P)H-binding protein [Puia sp.]